MTSVTTSWCGFAGKTAAGTASARRTRTQEQMARRTIGSPGNRGEVGPEDNTPGCAFAGLLRLGGPRLGTPHPATDQSASKTRLRGRPSASK